LLVPAPEGAKVGDDVAEQLGVTHYEPMVSENSNQKSGWEAVPAPSGYRPKYEVESLLRYVHVFDPNEPVIITEKIHGESARYCFHNGCMYCGSHREWKTESDTNKFWLAMRSTAGLEEFCRAYPNITVYGEIYGMQKGFDYGVPRDQIAFACFDLLRGNEWLDALDAREIGRNLPWVPTVALTNFSMLELEILASGKSLVPGASNIREGVVVKPLVERYHPECGRVCLKLVSPEYYEKK